MNFLYGLDDNNEETCSYIQGLIVTGCDTQQQQSFINDHLLYCSDCDKVKTDLEDLRYTTEKADFLDFIKVCKDGNEDLRKRQRDPRYVIGDDDDEDDDDEANYYDARWKKPASVDEIILTGQGRELYGNTTKHNQWENEPTLPRPKPITKMEPE